MNDNIRRLIEQIEKATGPDRELDVAIGLAVGRFFPLPPKWEGGPIGYGYIGEDGAERHPGHGGDQLVPRYTGSIDAAITLVPTGWIVEIRRYFNSDGEYVAAVDLTDGGTVGRGCHPEEELTVQSRIVEQRQGDDPTPSAICAAALKAMEAPNAE